MHCANDYSRLMKAIFILPFLLYNAVSQADDSLSAMGIGVKNLNASESFYKEVLGLKTLRTYELGYINEIVMGYSATNSASLVLMNWPKQDRRYDGTDVKLVFYVDDPAAVIERIRKYGLKVLREATPIETLNGRVVGMAQDPDNYVIEVIQAEPPI